MTRVYAKDIRAAKLCFGGARQWFRRHGLDWQDFVANGIGAERLEATGDALAVRVIAIAREREGCDPCEDREAADGR